MYHFYDQGRQTVNIIFSLSWLLQGASEESVAVTGGVTGLLYEHSLPCLSLQPGGIWEGAGEQAPAAKMTTDTQKGRSDFSRGK